MTTFKHQGDITFTPETKAVQGKKEAMAWKFSDDLHTVTPEQWKLLVAGADMN
jgi:hypothetical protein